MNALWIGSIVGALALSLATDSRALSTEELVALHVEWLGGEEALRGLESVTFEGAMNVAGLQGEASMVLERAGRLRFDFDLVVVSGAEVFTPTDAWVRNGSGQIEAMGADSRLSHSRSLDDAFGRWLLGPMDGVEVAATGPEVREGREFEVLAIRFANGDARELFLDAGTGEVVWTRSRDDATVSWSQALDWRTVAGLRFPFETRQLYEHASSNVTLKWDKIVVNAPVDPSAFERPDAGGAASALAGGRTSSDWMKIDLFLENYIYLTGTINGSETEMLLDSGAGITVVDSRFAKSIGLSGAGAITAKGVGGTTTASLAQDVRVEVGPDVFLEGLTVAIIDMSDVENMMSRPIPVIIGKEIFHRFVVDIDYPNERIAFHDPATFQYEGPGRSLELIADENGHKAVRARLEELPPALYKIDTGAGGALSVFDAYTREHSLLEGRRLSDDLSGGVGGSSVNKVGLMKSFEIAGETLPPLPVDFHLDNGGAFDTTRMAGNIGAGILNRFRCLFDYSRDQLILERGKQWDRPFPRDRLGLKIRKVEGRVVVVHVASGSPAEEAGWETGTAVREINGEALEANPYEVWLRHSRGPEGSTVNLVDGQGRRSVVVLSDYF